MNNPIQFVQSMRNPQAFMQQAMNNSILMQNPIARNALQMYQKGDKEGINQLVNNLCRERGMQPEEAYKQIKSQFGIN